MKTLDELEKEIFGDGSPKPTNLTCPVTGARLMAEPVEREVRDPSHFYFTEGHPEYRYERHPFSWNLFRQVYGGERRIGTKALRYWKLEESPATKPLWVEMVKPEGLGEVVPIDTPKSEIDLMIEKKALEHQIRNLEFQLRLLNGDPIFPMIKRVEAVSVGLNLVPIRPMEKATTATMYIDHIHEDKKILYPFIVSSENIEDVKKDWLRLPEYEKYYIYGDIKIGDTIDEWEYGGALSMRMGECVIRDGIEIYSRLTAMS